MRNVTLVILAAVLCLSAIGAASNTIPVEDDADQALAEFVCENSGVCVDAAKTTKYPRLSCSTAACQEVAASACSAVGGSWLMSHGWGASCHTLCSGGDSVTHGC
jgi:hypothetical protein